MKVQRIGSIDVIRLWLSLVIACYHCQLGLAPGAETAVMFFFITSGFFLAKKFYGSQSGEKAPSAWQYTLAHAGSFYPHLVFSVTVYYLYRLARYVLVECFREHAADWLANALRDLYFLIPEYTLTLSAYHKFMSTNFALWQLSVLVICGYFIYALLRRDEHLARTILLPAGFLMSESLMYYEPTLWENVGPFYMALVRGFAPMTAGVFIYLFTTTKAYAALKRHRWLGSALLLASLAALTAYGLEERAAYFPMAGILLVCWDPDSHINRLLNGRLFRRAGRLSVAIFLDHMMICNFVVNPVSQFLTARGIAVTDGVKAAVYIPLLIAYSLCSSLLVDTCVARWRAKHRKEGQEK